MSALSIQPTYPIFTETDGQPLENGYIWIGTTNLDPQVNPINVYWDAALTQLAAQPIRTEGGYPVNNGTPARLYVNSDYSIRVMNRNGSTVYSAPAATERYSDAVVRITADSVEYTPPQVGAVAETVADALDVSVRNNQAQFPVNTEKVWISETGWNPSTDPIFGRSTPGTATIAIGGHFDEAGGAGINYKWGLSSWYTNPGTMPITNIDAVAQGWKVRGGGMAARQCGDGGDGHALELLSGQWAAKATVNTTAGSAILAVTDVTFKGSKFCVGNQISGTGIPGGSTIVSVTQDGNTTTVSGEGFGYPGTIVISAPATATGTSNITVLSADTLGFALLISGSGDGGSDGTGNPNGIGIGFQSYKNAAFYRGINFGVTSLRSNGTGIRFAIGTAQRGISFESYNLEQAIRFSGGTAINIIQTTGVTCTGSMVSFGSTTATNGINFASSNVFSGAAILLSGQNIDTDNTTGMKIGLSAARKIGFWNATPVVQPSAIPNAAGGTEVATINSILTALRNIGLIAT